MQSRSKGSSSGITAAENHDGDESLLSGDYGTPDFHTSSTDDKLEKLKQAEYVVSLDDTAATNSTSSASASTSTSSSICSSTLLCMRTFISNPIRFLFGDITSFELKQFSLLSIIFFFIVGSFWLLRPLKDGIFMVMVGNEQLATARIVTFLSVIPMIVFVNVLNDWFSRFTVVAIVNTCFAVSFSCVNILLRTDQFGLGPPERPPSPDRFVGWINYLLIEAYGSVAIATFWAMVNVSTKSAHSAKRCYPLLVISGQVAGVLGPFVSRYSRVFGLVNLQMFGNIGVYVVVLLVLGYVYIVERPLARALAARANDYAADDASLHRAINADDDDAAEDSAAATVLEKKPVDEKTTSGILISFKLLLTNPYLMGIAAVSTIYEVVGTIMDQQMKQQAAVYFDHDRDKYTAFLSDFGLYTNLFSLVIALTGTSSLLRFLGIRFSILLFPVISAGLCIMIAAWPEMMVIYVGQLILKGIGYAINNPAKEILYSPTTPDVKLKVKQWIDVFGQRSAKATGAFICEPFRTNIPGLLLWGSWIAFAWTGIWIVCAFFTGLRYNTLIKAKEDAEQTAEMVASSSLEDALDSHQDRTHAIVVDLDDMASSAPSAAVEKQQLFDLLMADNDDDEHEEDNHQQQ